MLGQLEPYFNEILVSVSSGQNVERQRRSRPGRPPRIRIVEDESPNQGPLGGILAGLKAAANAACAVIACDIPDIDVSLLRSLARAAGNAEVAVPVGPAGHFEPLFAVYRRTCATAIRRALDAGQRRVISFFPDVRLRVVEAAEAQAIDPDPWCFFNVNTPDDLAEAERRLRAAGAKEIA